MQHLSKITSLFLFLLFLSPITYSKPPLEKKTLKLKTITQKIQDLEEKLSSFAKSKENTIQELKESETHLGETAKKIAAIRKQLQGKNKQLSSSEKTLKQHRAQLQKESEQLSKQIHSAYKLGKHPFLKLLFNQESPEKINRTLQYYRHFNQVRLETILTIKNTLKKIESATQTIRKQADELNTTRRNYQNQKNNQQSQLKQRKQILGKINSDIKNKQKELDKFKNDKARLEKVIKTLRSQVAYQYAPGARFHEMAGALHWPIKSRQITQHFREPLADGRLHSTGIVIHAPNGMKIHSVFPGKVVFANWLRGFGLLVIIQHGQDYLTLYGRNQSIYVKRGDDLQAGQLIGTVGNSGGFEKDSLYFEIRQKGTPVNPLKWLKGTSRN